MRRVLGVLCFFSIIFIIISLHPQKASAQLCYTYGGSCMAIRGAVTCNGNCNLCTNRDPYTGDSLGCGAGTTCCDPNIPVPTDTPVPPPQTRQDCTYFGGTCAASLGNFTCSNCGNGANPPSYCPPNGNQFYDLYPYCPSGDTTIYPPGTTNGYPTNTCLTVVRYLPGGGNSCQGDPGNTSPAFWGGPCCVGNNTGGPTPPPACNPATISAVSMSPVARGATGAFGTVENSSVTAGGDYQRVDWGLKVTDNKDGSSYTTSGNGSSTHTFTMDTTGMPAAQPGEIYTYTMTFNAWDTCTGNVHSVSSQGSVHMQMPSISGEVYIDSNGNGKLDAGEQDYTGSAVQINYTWNGGGNHTYTTNNGAGNGTPDGTYAIAVQPNTYTVSINLPANYVATTVTSKTQNVTGQAVIDFGIQPTYTIQGSVFIDYNHDGAINGADTVDATRTYLIDHSPQNNSGNVDTTNGTYTFQEIAGTYQTWIDSGSVPAGYVGDPTNPAVVLPPDTTHNLGITPLYSISGTLYIDNNADSANPANNYYTTNEDSLYTGSGTKLTISGPPGSNPTVTRNNAQGTYSITNLISGTYTITVSPPDGFLLTYPPASAFSVTVGKPATNPACDAAGYHATDLYNNQTNTLTNQTNAACDANGNITNLDIGMVRNPWDQIVCGDVRTDTGITNPVPGAGVSCGTTSSAYGNITNSSCPASPGIVYTGNTDANFSPGDASSTDWIVGGTQYPETFTASSGDYRSSYTYISQTIAKSCDAPKDFNPTVCPDFGNCSPSSGLNSGIYKASGNVTLNGFTPSVIGRNYIFLIDGDLTINGNIIIPQGTTAIFAVSGNITVGPNVGNSDITIPCDITQNGHPGCNIEGFFTTEKDFIINSRKFTGPTCGQGGVNNDLRLNIDGNVVISSTKGAFINYRTLCIGNLTCPTFSITNRPDLWLNSLTGNRCLLRPNFSQIEVAPNQ